MLCNNKLQKTDYFSSIDLNYLVIYSWHTPNKIRSNFRSLFSVKAKFKVIFFVKV